MKHEHARNLALHCAAVAALAVAFSFVYAAVRISDAAATIAAASNRLPGIVDAQLSRFRSDAGNQISSAVSVAQSEIDDTRAAAVDQIQTTSALLLGEAEATRETFAALGVAGLKLADEHAGALEDQVAKTTDSLTLELDPMRKLADQVNAAAPPFLDCKSGANPDCLFTRYQSIAGSAQEMFEQGAKAAPVIVKMTERTEAHIDHITGDVQKVADRIVKPKSKKQIVLDALFPAALLASRFF